MKDNLGKYALIKVVAFKNGMLDIPEIKDAFDDLYDAVKTLEIIKRKYVYGIMLKDTTSVDEYNDMVSCFPTMRLTQEEYDLLKEELE